MLVQSGKSSLCYVTCTQGYGFPQQSAPPHWSPHLLHKLRWRSGWALLFQRWLPRRPPVALSLHSQIRGRSWPFGPGQVLQSLYSKCLSLKFCCPLALALPPEEQYTHMYIFLLLLSTTKLKDFHLTAPTCKEFPTNSRALLIFSSRSRAFCADRSLDSAEENMDTKSDRWSNTSKNAIKMFILKSSLTLFIDDGGVSQCILGHWGIFHSLHCL